jgi:hypothetical protein
MTDHATSENLRKLARLIAVGQPLNSDAVSEAIVLCATAWEALEEKHRQAFDGAKRIHLEYGVVGDWDGAYRWADDGEYIVVRKETLR